MFNLNYLHLSNIVYLLTKYVNVNTAKEKVETVLIKNILFNPIYNTILLYYYIKLVKYY